MKIHSDEMTTSYNINFGRMVRYTLLRYFINNERSIATVDNAPLGMNNRSDIVRVLPQRHGSRFGMSMHELIISVTF